MFSLWSRTLMHVLAYCLVNAHLEPSFMSVTHSGASTTRWLSGTSPTCTGVQAVMTVIVV